MSRQLSGIPGGSLQPQQLVSEPDVRELFSTDVKLQETLERRLPEWAALEALCKKSVRLGKVENWGRTSGSYQLPLISLTFGSTAPEAPSLVLTGGVHGLERIGSQVVLSLLSSFTELLLWDQSLNQILERVRVVWFPLVNPVGTLLQQRGNAQGVDLMRNSPTDCEEATAWLVSGHRWGPWLPWYRGLTPGVMEIENQSLVSCVWKSLQSSTAAVSLDFHSGFGTSDQIWFPYAKSKKPFPQLAEFHAWKETFESTHPHHFYKIEPQAKNYTTHGDVWDYLFDHYTATNPQGAYLPLTIEMGSWLWVKKNPSQIFSTLGPYNPIVPHRRKRILRRHQTLLDFCLRSLFSNQVWTSLDTIKKERHHAQALELWY